MQVSSPHLVTAMLSDDSNMNAWVPTAIFSGFNSAFDAPSKQPLSGPCGVIIEWSVAPPGLKPLCFASYLPKIKPVKKSQNQTFEFDLFISFLYPWIRSCNFDDNMVDGMYSPELTISEGISQNLLSLYQADDFDMLKQWICLDPAIYRYKVIMHAQYEFFQFFVIKNTFIQ